ncbi:MAG: hypothetical protein QME81_01230 [bacterium]|nr:hypothetical protein [bacterium]
MGDVYLSLTVTNDADISRQKDIQFLADSGAARAWIDKDAAEELDITEQGRVPLELADGQIVEYPYGLCKFVYEGEIVNGTVIIGPQGCEPLVGTHVLQDFRLNLDFVHHRVVRARAMRAKYSF